MICYVIKQFDRRPVGTVMPHLPDELALSLIKKGYLSETAPETVLLIEKELVAEENMEVSETAPETQTEIPEQQIKNPTKRGRKKLNKK